MGPPVCQIKAYQKVSPKLKHTSITQNSQIGHGNWEKIKCLQKESTKIYKNY